MAEGMNLPSDNFEELKTFDASLVYDDERRAALKSSIQDTTRGMGAPDKVMQGLHFIFRPVLLGCVRQERSDLPRDAVVRFKSQLPNLYTVLKEAVEEQAEEEKFTWNRTFEATMSNKLYIYRASVEYKIACEEVEMEYQIAVEEAGAHHDEYQIAEEEAGEDQGPDELPNIAAQAQPEQHGTNSVYSPD